MMPIDIKQAFEFIIDERVQFLKHYYGQVFSTDDPEHIGRVLVLIPDIGWFDADSASWALPRGDFSVPEKDDYVEIYFMNGNPAMPVYMGIAPEMNNMLQKSYTGNPDTKIIFDNKKTKSSILFDQKTKTFTFDLGGNVQIIIEKLGITLKSGDAAAWKPNTMIVDPFSGAPHSVGIVKLKGA